MLYNRVAEEKLAHQELMVAMEKLAQLVHQETQDLQVHRASGETEASLGQGDSLERSDPRVHPERQALMETLDSLEQVASQGRRDPLETQYGGSCV